MKNDIKRLNIDLLPKSDEIKQVAEHILRYAQKRIKYIQ